MTSEDARAGVWEGVDEQALALRWGIPAVHLYRSVGSTNDVARRLAADGAAAGTLCLADRQTAGRGRAGRGWESPAGKGIWMSMIVPPPASAREVGMLPLRAGLAAAMAIEPFIPTGRVGLKWPNDLVLEGAKLGGILCEGTWSGDLAGPVVVGVGVNVSQTSDELPPSIQSHATSIATASGDTPDRLRVADSLVGTLARHLISDPLPDGRLAAEIGDRDLLLGRRVTVQDSESGEPRLEGVAIGIGPDGALQLEVEEAGSEGQSPRHCRVVSVRAGTIRLAGRPAAISPGSPRA